MKKVYNVLVNKNLTISFAESITGGYLSFSLVKNSGSSKVFKGSIVTYTNELKETLLNVDINLINEYGVVSSEVATSMLLGLKAKIKADIYVAITGNAGPTFEKSSNSLISYIAIFYNNEIYNYNYTYNKSRVRNIKNIEKFIERKILNLLNDK